MASQEEEITLVGVDTDGIRPHGSGEGFQVPFKLSGVPDGQWKKAFEVALSSTISTTRRPTVIAGDTILVTLHEGDRQQDQVDYLKRVVVETDKLLQRAQQDAAARGVVESKKAEETQRKVDALRDEANKLDF
jgi:hypothetical protein